MYLVALTKLNHCICVQSDLEQLTALLTVQRSFLVCNMKADPRCLLLRVYRCYREENFQSIRVSDSAREVRA